MSEKAIHTPGPWMWNSGLGDVCGGDGDPVANQVSGQDASLICAAPEMLDALRVAHSYFSKYIKFCSGGEKQKMAAAVGSVKDAIAKAEGRS